MTIDKFKYSEPNSELQEYVASLLVDQPADAFDKKRTSNVTLLNRPSVKKTQSTDRAISAETTISKTAKINVIETAGNKKQKIIEIEQSKAVMRVSKNQLSEKNTGAQDLTQFDSASPDPRLKNVEKLLSKISLVHLEEPTAQDGALKTSQSDDLTEQALIESAHSTFGLRKDHTLKEVLGDVFQTLVFEVNRLPLAVPLVKLGGIINISAQQITPLVGTPDWFMGLVANEGQNLLVVDTQKFLMPEKASVDDREYSFLIVLDDSNWALACHTVGEAKNLTPEHVRWSSISSKRPWFAGMVLEYMSALLEVDKLINLLAENIVD